MPRRIAFAVSALLVLAALPAGAAETTMDFNSDSVGAPPKGFTLARTGGGRLGAWVVRAEAGGNKVLAQTDADAVDNRFPLAVLDAVTARDVDVSVRFKPISGSEDQAAGLVWRYKDAQNYYIVRANALEDNVVLYKVEKGRRSDLPLKGKGRTYGAKAPVPKGQWSTLRIVAQGNLFTASLNGQTLFEVEDKTFVDAGKVGVWTKADSVMEFDDLKVATK